MNIYTSCSAKKPAANTSFPSRADLAEAAALKEQQRRSEMAAAAAATKAIREQQVPNASRVALAREQAHTLSRARCLFLSLARHTLSGTSPLSALTNSVALT